MLDIETLGTAPGSVVLAIGAAASDGSEYFDQVAPTDALYRGLATDPDTLAWWRKQAPEVWARQCAGTKTLPYVLEQFRLWLQKIRNGAEGAVVGNRIRVWGDGATFDCVLVEEAYRRCNLPCPWTYTEVYCYRTLRQLKDSKKPIPKEHHNALSDAQAQLQHLRELLA